MAEANQVQANVNVRATIDSQALFKSLDSVKSGIGDIFKGRFVSGFKQLQAGVDSFAQSNMAGSQAAKALSKNMAAIASHPYVLAVVIVLGAIVAAIVKLVSWIEEFRKAAYGLIKVMNLTASSSIEVVGVFRKASFEAGVSAKATLELVQAYAQIDRGFISSAESAKKWQSVMVKANKLQKVFGLSSQEVADILAFSTNVLGKSTEETEAFVDTLVDVAMSSNLSVSELSNLLKSHKTLVLLFGRGNEKMIKSIASVTGAMKAFGESADSFLNFYQSTLDFTNTDAISKLGAIANFSGKTLAQLQDPGELFDASIMAIRNVAAANKITAESAASDIATFAGGIGKALGFDPDEVVRAITLGDKLIAKRKELVALQKSLGVEKLDERWATITSTFGELWAKLIMIVKAPFVPFLEKLAAALSALFNSDEFKEYIGLFKQLVDEYIPALSAGFDGDTIKDFFSGFLQFSKNVTKSLITWKPLIVPVVKAVATLLAITTVLLNPVFLVVGAFTAMAIAAGKIKRKLLEVWQIFVNFTKKTGLYDSFMRLFESMKKYAASFKELRSTLFSSMKPLISIFQALQKAFSVITLGPLKALFGVILMVGAKIFEKIVDDLKMVMDGFTVVFNIIQSIIQWVSNVLNSPEFQKALAVAENPGGAVKEAAKTGTDIAIGGARSGWFGTDAMLLGTFIDWLRSSKDNSDKTVELHKEQVRIMKDGGGESGLKV